MHRMIIVYRCYHHETRRCGCSFASVHVNCSGHAGHAGLRGDPQRPDGIAKQHLLAVVPDTVWVDRLEFESIVPGREHMSGDIPDEPSPVVADKRPQDQRGG